jgi:hypothetical protein
MFILFAALACSSPVKAQDPSARAGKAADEGQTWPSGYFDLMGCLGESGLEAPPELSHDDDVARESL